MSAVMQCYKYKQIDELARQLQHGPKRLVLRRLIGVEFALSVIEPNGAYPFEFVRHAVTGVRNYAPHQDGQIASMLKGRDLRADLTRLAENLSASARVPAAASPVPVSDNHELARRFGVSLRTITRWRKRGLACWKMVGEDGRLHTLFPENAVRRFVAENTGLIQKAANFSQLDQSEHEVIIQRARELADGGGKTMHAIAVSLAKETGRGRETIRLILRRYDKDNPEQALFTQRESDDVETRRLQVWSAYQDGLTVRRIAERFKISVSDAYAIVTQMRAREIKSNAIEYIDCPDFARPNADDAILNAVETSALFEALPRGQRIPPGLPSYLRDLFEIPLLTPAGETALFRKMNYLKYKADLRRRDLEPEDVKAAELDEIERLLQQAGDVKNALIRSNLRLVVRFAKRHMSSTEDLFELISEGNMALMRAVDLFDYTRGFKFSTYASWAIIRQLAGSTNKSRRHRARFRTGHEEFHSTVASVADVEHFDSENDELLKYAAEKLSTRQWFVLSRHYGLNKVRTPQTLEEIGKQLGVSKERVRQIESQALGLLRADLSEQLAQQTN